MLCGGREPLPPPPPTPIFLSVWIKGYISFWITELIWLYPITECLSTRSYEAEKALRVALLFMNKLNKTEILCCFRLHVFLASKRSRFSYRFCIRGSFKLYLIKVKMSLSKEWSRGHSLVRGISGMFFINVAQNIQLRFRAKKRGTFIFEFHASLFIVSYSLISMVH